MERDERARGAPGRAAMTRLARQPRIRRLRPVSPPALDPVSDSRVCGDPRSEAGQSAEGLRLARQLYLIRRCRDRAFGPAAAVFRDPAWDMILDLFAARLEGRRTSISSAAIAARIPQTTAIRLVDQLVDRKLIRRIADEQDGRRSLLELTPMAVDMMWRFLASVGQAPALEPARGN